MTPSITKLVEWFTSLQHGQTSHQDSPHQLVGLTQNFSFLHHKTSSYENSMPQCKTMPSRFHHDIDPMAMSLIPQQILDLLIAQVLLHQASNKWTCSMSKLLGPYHGISSIHASGEIQWRNCSLWKSSNWTHPECWSSPQPLLCYIMGPMPRQQFFQHLHPLTTALMTHSSLHTSSQQATPIRNLKLNILQLHHSAVTIHHHHLGCVGCPSKCKSHSFQFLAVFVHVVRA